PARFLWRRRLPDERRQVPAAVRLARGRHARPCDGHAADEQGRAEQLRNRVADGDLFDADQRPTVARQTYIVELDTSHERPAEPADVEPGGKIPVRRANRQAANLLPSPGGLQNREAGSDEDEREADDPD